MILSYGVIIPEFHVLDNCNPVCYHELSEGILRRKGDRMEKKQYKKRKRKKQRRKKQPSMAAAGVCLLMAVLVLSSLLLYKHYTQMVQVSGNGIQWTDANRWTLLDVNGYSEEIIACEMDGNLYISAEYINEQHAEEAMFLDTDQGRIYYTTASKKNVFTPDSATVYVNGEEYVYERIFNTYEGQWLVQLEWASQQFGIEYFQNPDQKIVTLYPDERDTARVSGSEIYLKKSALGGSIIDAITGNTEGYAYYRVLQDKEQVVVLGQESDHMLVMTEDGYRGYVEKTALEQTEKQYTVNPDAAIVELPESRKIEGNVVLAWHQDYTGSFTETTKETFAAAKGIVNVISPTWFKFTDSGKLTSCANGEYVKWAHEEGYQIWALIDNDFTDEKTQIVLKSEEMRTGLIEELLEACETLNLDGINVDFEALSEETAPYFVEFMRELAAVLRPAGYCVSVDVSVPEAWSYYYRRDLLAQCCDYVIVMGYDEHYRGGGVTGSVSSIPWAAEAAANMLEQAPAGKVILGVPFYTQLWVTGSDGRINNEAMSMETVLSWIQEYHAELRYDEVSGQDYASCESGGNRYEIWIENEMSMEKRMQIAEDNQMAGVACWKMGMETEELWSVIQEYAAD